MVTTVVTFGIAIVIISMIAYYSYVATIVTRSVAIVVIEVLVYVDFNIRASYTVVPVFCVVIRPFSLGSMGDMSCRRNKNIVTYGTYLRLGLGRLCTGSMSYGSIGYGTACVLTYVPVIVCIGSPSFSEVMRLCIGCYCVTDATYYRCRAVVIIVVGSMSYGSISYGTACVLTYVPVVVCIGSPSFSEVVRLCGSCYCVTDATYYRCRAVAVVSLWSMSCYSGVLTACIVTGCVTCVIPCVSLTLNENLLATKLTEYRSFAIAVVLCRLVVALGCGRAGYELVDLNSSTISLGTIIAREARVCSIVIIVSKVVSSVATLSYYTCNTICNNYLPATISIKSCLSSNVVLVIFYCSEISAIYFKSKCAVNCTCRKNNNLNTC